MRRTDRAKSDRKYLKANILGFSLKIHKTRTILLSIMIFITLIGLALAKVYNMKQSQNITDKAITRKTTQQETSTRKKASSTQIELPEETDAQNGPYEATTNSAVLDENKTSEKHQFATCCTCDECMLKKQQLENASNNSTYGRFMSQGEEISPPKNVPAIIWNIINEGQDVYTFIDPHFGFRIYEVGTNEFIVETELTTPDGKQYMLEKVDNAEARVISEPDNANYCVEIIK